MIVRNVAMESKIIEMFNINRFSDADSTSSYEIDIPHNWKINKNHPWTYIIPPTKNIPEQGWKIHISSVENISQQVINIVSKIAFEKEVYFKYITTPSAFRKINSKYADRASAGKFIVIYASNLNELESLLEILDSSLSNFPGGYILSDVKYKDSPVYVRYGGFKEKIKIDNSGSEILCIENSQGDYIEDSRGPSLTIPDFVKIPSFLQKQVDERLNPSDNSLNKLIEGYKFEFPLHYSNGGGVYLLTRKSDNLKFVMKEGRKNVAFDPRGADSFERVQNEYITLLALSENNYIAKPIKYSVVDEHNFLFEEYVGDTDLHSWISKNYPFSDDKSKDDYAKQANTFIDQMVDAVKNIHKTGLAFMDIQPNNLIVNNLNIKFIDLESCKSIYDRNPQSVIGTPGYIPKNKYSPKQRDYYGLFQVALNLFVPISSISSISDSAALELMDLASEIFGKSKLYKVYDLYNKILNEEILENSFIKNYKSSIVDNYFKYTKNGLADLVSLKNTANDEIQLPMGSQPTPSGIDKLSIQNGLVGVAFALGDSCPISIIDNIELSVKKLNFYNPAFLTGCLGVAAYLSYCGRHESAINLYLSCKELVNTYSQNISIRTGISGNIIGLLILDKYTGNKEIRKDLLELVDTLKGLVNNPPEELKSAGSVTNKPMGLLDGWAGVSLTFSLLGKYFKDKNYYIYSKKSIELDLKNLVEASDGSLQIDDEFRIFPHFDGGSGGIGIALAFIPNRFLDPRHYKILKKIKKSQEPIVCASGGLFHGRCGLLLSKYVLENKLDSLNSFDLHKELKYMSPYIYNIRHGKSLFMTGEHNNTFSYDVATGISGFLIFLTLVTNNRLRGFLD